MLHVPQHPVHRNSVMERVLLIPLLHHKQTCSMPTALARTLVGTRDTAVDTVSQDRISLLHLRTIFTLGVFPMHLDLPTIVNQAKRGAHCLPVSAVIKKMMVWQLPLSFSHAASEALELQGAFRSLSLRML